MSTNPELELAHRYVSQTDRHIFLTGKAGTGKTTFLHKIRDMVPKRKVVVAPTGVAAINAKGVTIHSQFQLPFGVLSPDRLQAELRTHRLGREKAEVLRGLDLLVIDEISMVRADVLDALSAVLSKYRADKRPFGGVQLLMIGDLHQLPPVVRDNEWVEMSRHYETPYFFGSRELARSGVITIQLKHIYRQSDGDFIDLLNRVRHDRMDEATLSLLNSRYRGAEFEPRKEDEYITLTSHNRTANAINERQLGTLSTPLHHFEAEIEGQFPASMYPNDPKQAFRVGAQVMFNKNDTAGHAYYNGKIGRITAIEGERITVVSPSEESIAVLPVVWENRKYELNKQSKEVTDEVIGTFTQHPLRLAWAITIHKSQGLTFERVIIDAAAAFAHGQVYVALSRCKTFEGIVLRSRIGSNSVKTDRVVSDYSTRAEEQAPTAEDLAADRRLYQYNCLRELFDFSGTDRHLAQLERTLFEHEQAVQGKALEEARQIREALEAKIGQVSRSFQLQLKTYQQATHLPSESEELGTRLKKAGAYMVPAIKELYANLGQLSFMSDNRKVYDAVTERMKACGLDFAIKLRCFQSLDEGFTPDRYLRARTDAILDFQQERKKSPSKPTVTLDTVSHPELYAQLVEWRTHTASELGVPAYRILHNAVLLTIAGILPGDADALQAIPGIGKRKFEMYGDEILALVSDYAEEQDVSVHSGSFELTEKADAISTPGLSSREITLAAFRAGTSVDQIASDRDLTVGTIHSHLLHWVKKGELAAEEVVPAERLAPLTAFLADYSGEGLRPVFEHFGEQYSYEEIRIAAATLVVKD
ncbi:UvrD-like helicase family protein [Neolewinella xylanilytica]|uniref:UvrD-like helicase family protein n=1 Tax=Neolewinella xylanilytica TaxID=1514080 RepID=A0A2S6I3L7_9BACT|nr:helix-turn-helix domain-containing protein [Neolewinella xylanilytica]PPK85661.1 UvrD-like helicase family protein [Neolewinella xylanilytica]